MTLPAFVHDLITEVFRTDPTDSVRRMAIFTGRQFSIRLGISRPVYTLPEFVFDSFMAGSASIGKIRRINR